MGVESEGVTGRASSGRGEVGRGELIQAVRQECGVRSWGAVAVAVCRESQTERVICQKWEWRCPLVVQVRERISVVRVCMRGVP